MYDLDGYADLHEGGGASIEEACNKEVFNWGSGGFAMHFQYS